MPLRALPPRVLPLLPLTCVLLALVLLGAGTIGLLRHPTTVADPAPPAGKTEPVAATHGFGFTIRGQWIGTWRTADGSGFCIEFDKAHPDSSGVKPVGKSVPGMSPAESARVRHVTTAYGPTRSRVDGAAAAIYVWQVQNTDRFDRYYAKLVKQGLVSDEIQRRVGEIAAEARNHGPFRLTMSMGAGYPGQTVRGQVTVRAHNGKVVKGMKLSLAANAHGVLTSRARTSDAKGRVPFTARVTALGALRVDATLVTPGPGIWVTAPTPGRQRLVLAGKDRSTVRATVSSERRIGAPTVSSECGSDCSGAAPVVVRMTNPCGSLPLREFVLADGGTRPVAVVDVAPCRSASATVQLPDNTLVTTAFCYLDARKRCIDPPKSNGGRLRVECPPLVEYRFAGTCPCADAKTVTYQVKAPAGSVRRYVVTMVSSSPSGPRVDRLTLRNGQWESLPAVTLRRGDTVKLSVTVLGRTTTLDAVSQDI